MDIIRWSAAPELDRAMELGQFNCPLSLLQLIYKQKGPSHIALITDSMRAAGSETKESIIGSPKDGMKVLIEDGVAKLPDRSAFAGSVVTIDCLVRNMIHLAGVPLLYAVQMITTTPAQICRVNYCKGTLTEGKVAYILIFDEQIVVQTIIINGYIINNDL